MTTSPPTQLMLWQPSRRSVQAIAASVRGSISSPLSLSVLMSPFWQKAQRMLQDVKKIVPDCIQLTPKVVAKMDWLPKTCGYRLVHFKQDLYWWHPLVSGDPETVHQAGISARGRVIPEDQVEDISERVVDWFA